MVRVPKSSQCARPCALSGLKVTCPLLPLQVVNVHRDCLGARRFHLVNSGFYVAKRHIVDVGYLFLVEYG